eukprot:jgi/Chlat1/2981/Chrsp2S04704
MGAGPSLPAALARQLDGATQFDKKQLAYLYRRYVRLLDPGADGLMRHQFAQLPELTNNVFVSQVFETFDKNKDGKLNFVEFATAMSDVMVMSGSEEKTQQFAFNVYDINGDNYISREELASALRHMLDPSISEAQHQQIVDSSLQRFDVDKDGKLSFSEFKAFISVQDN